MKKITIMGIIAMPTVTSFQSKWIYPVFVCLFLFSCGANVTVKPDVPLSNNRNPVTVRGDIVYEANPIYLPSTIEQKKDTGIKIKWLLFIPSG